MPRLPALITINITNHETGHKAKIELCRGLSSKHFVCRFNRKNSRLNQIVTLTKLRILLITLITTMIFKPESYALKVEKLEKKQIAA